MPPNNNNESTSLATLACPTLVSACSDGGPVGPPTIGVGTTATTAGNGDGACNTPSITTHSLYGAHHVLNQTITPMSSLIITTIGGYVPSVRGV